jgi:hypothetical protein
MKVFGPCTVLISGLNNTPYNTINQKYVIKKKTQLK